MAETQELHVIGISGGKDSTALALRLVEIEPSRRFLFLITPTGDELPEMRAHWDRLRSRFTGLGHAWVELRHPRGGLRELSVRQRALPNTRFRWCTRMLKLEPYAAYLRQLRERAATAGTRMEVYSYIGLRADEEEREGMTSANVHVCFPLRTWGWGLKEVRGYLAEQGIEIPKRTDCARCPYQRIGEWWALYQEHPDIYQDAVEHEAEVSQALGRSVTIRNPGRDRWPAGLAELRDEFDLLRNAVSSTEDRDAGRLAETACVDVLRARRWLRLLAGAERDDGPAACRVCTL